MAMAKRVYQLSQIEEIPSECPFQPSFRHLCNVLQINDGDIDKTKSFYKEEIKSERDERRFKERANCAHFWLENNAPEEFKFKLNSAPPKLDLSQNQQDFILKLGTFLSDSWEEINSDKELHEKIYQFIHDDEELDPQAAFKALYQILINQEKGPKLAGFIRTIGKERIIPLLLP